MNDERDVWVREVGTRDGLQSIATVFPTAAKLDWIRLEAAAGVPEIEVGSFVPPKLLPQMADSAEVVRGAKAIAGLRVAALVPNLRGAENAFAAGADQLNYVVSVSEAHSQANVRKSVAEALDEFAAIMEYRRNHPEYAHVRVASGLATAFGCTIAGPVDPADVVRAAERLVELGADELAVADTVGYGNPAQCRRIFAAVLDVAGDIPVGAHFHDTRGLGLANVDAALEVGVRRFDASLAGLGGCPYAPGASGNIVTEDLVFMLEAMGLRTGIDLDGLLAARELMARHLDGEPTHGAFVTAGAPKGFVAASRAA
ncbi:MAG: hydroxymethylglutaryl-CoA lyase [Gammaproteobacteria bacterium]|nr:hydroxymethylglutaryl-CoA lyase [Gammaproteobacteria bacterium]